MRLSLRLDRLEAKQPAEDAGRVFLWPMGQTLADALSAAGLTLEDKPLMAIRLLDFDGYCPVHEPDLHLVA